MNLPPFTVVPDCAVCGSADGSPFAVEKGFPLVSCRDCGFVFLSPRPDAAGVASLYSDPDLNVFGSEKYAPFELERAPLERLVRALRKEVPTGRLLEIGCGRGDLLRVARGQGYEVSGCDFSGGVKPELEGVPFYDGELKNAGLPSSYWDIVILRLTLEHLFAPLEDLAEIRRVLKPGGLLYLKVPNVRFEHPWTCLLMNGHPMGYHTPYHLSHFSPRTLDRLLERAGFSPLRGFVEQPSRRLRWKADLPRQAFYRLAQALRFLSAGRVYPKIVLSGTARKTGA